MTVQRDLFGAVELKAPRARVGRRLFLAAPARRMAEEMRREGASLAAIAAALGIAEATVLTRLSVELERGMPGGRRPGRPTWTPSDDDRAAVAHLAAEGFAVGRIAAALGVSMPTLRRWCGADLRQGRARRSADRVRT